MGSPQWTALYGPIASLLFVSPCDFIPLKEARSKFQVMECELKNPLILELNEVLEDSVYRRFHIGL